MAVFVGVLVGVGVRVAVAVFVGVAVNVAVAVGVAVGQAAPLDAFKVLPLTGIPGISSFSVFEVPSTVAVSKKLSCPGKIVIWPDELFDISTHVICMDCDSSAGGRTRHLLVKFGFSEHIEVSSHSGMGVFVGVAVLVDVAVGVNVCVLVGVLVAVAVFVAVAVLVEVGVMLGV